jgi:hypothetical protein
MAVPTKFGAVRNTVGGAFTQQVIGGVVMGINTTSTILTEGMTLMEGVVLADGNAANALPRERTSTGIYRAAKIVSGGTFAYNAARNNTWIVAKMSTSIGGVSSDKLLFMGQGATNGRSIAEFRHDIGVKMLTAWVNGRFSWTGKLADGSSKASRIMWLNAAGTAVSAPSTLSTTFMRDLADGNATDMAVDSATNPTRSIPGEFVLRADFVTAGLSGGNFFDYKPITGM